MTHSDGKFFDSALAALGGLQDGATVMVGGFGLVGAPLTLIEALCEHGAKDLTIISNNLGEPGGKGLSKLLKLGRIRKAIGSYFTSNPEVVAAVERGELHVQLLPQGTLAEAIRAGGAGLGGFFTPVGAGTLLAAGKEERVIDGKRFVLEAPLKADFALVRARRADALGNLVYDATQQNFNVAMSSAARVTVAEVDEVVEVGAVAPEMIHTPHLFVKRLVKAEVLITDVKSVAEMTR
ncbi:CoA transferase subunit A [Deinococcus yavapaiensis]|uniref:3-oxoadipate CoA-transferase alpha subunit n=1 Tax=Deinococcus yavapaiensis KR-236 TaxID=694435 RepID=A0A318SAP0_9DEIO|nr:3-oxoacid CoA-transferase subunit A [Deinococcus yavapaiensis]PYE56480.1 3-oxoadipate CoA-transferase alpha subunit [Deinococcus yavapaiensis KR-236]